MKHLVPGLLLIAIAVPAVAEPPADVYPIVGVSVRTEAETGRPFRIAVTLGPGAPAGDTLGAGSIELRRTGAPMQPLRPVLHLVDDWWYEAWVEFDEPGEWQLLFWPDVAPADRSEIGGIVAARTIVVTRGPPGWLGSVLIVTLGIGLMVFAVRSRRPRKPGRRTAPAHPGDSWWWGP